MRLSERAEGHISNFERTVDGFLKGILTRRDLRFLTDKNKRVSEVMSHNNLVTAAENVRWCLDIGRIF
jgi:IMP dehydrogenase